MKKIGVINGGIFIRWNIVWLGKGGDRYICFDME